MTKDDLNRKLCGLLGICWHNMEYVPAIEGNTREWWKCSCGKCFAKVGEALQHISDNPKPDFTSDAGKVQLLREMMKREDFDIFIKTVGSIKCCVSATYTRADAPPITEVCVWGMPVVRVDLILDTTGQLAKAAIEHLEKEEGK